MHILFPPRFSHRPLCQTLRCEVEVHSMSLAQISNIFTLEIPKRLCVHSFTFSIGGASTREKYKEMEDLKKQEESRQERIIKAKENLAAAEPELENRPPYEPP